MLEEFENVKNENSAFFYKNFYFDYYNYFNELKINFSDFNYLIKISNLKLKTTHDGTSLYTKPYSILRNSKQDDVFPNPYTLFYHAVFKNYNKFTSSFMKHFNIFDINKVLPHTSFFFMDNLSPALIFKNLTTFDDFLFKKNNTMNYFSKLKLKKYDKISIFFKKTTHRAFNSFFKKKYENSVEYRLFFKNKIDSFDSLLEI